MAASTQLAFSEPRGEAAIELTRLLGTRAELQARLDQLDREQREAGETLAQRSAELTALEKRGLWPGSPPPTVPVRGHPVSTSIAISGLLDGHLHA